MSSPQRSRTPSRSASTALVRAWFLRHPRGSLFLAGAVLVALCSSSLSRPLALSYPPQPARPAGAPLEVSVERTFLPPNGSSPAVVQDPTAGAIKRLAASGSVLEVLGVWAVSDQLRTRLVVRSDQPLFVVDAQRVGVQLNPADTNPADAKPGFRILLANRDLARVHRPCILVEDNPLRPLASSSLVRCGTW